MYIEKGILMFQIVKLLCEIYVCIQSLLLLYRRSRAGSAGIKLSCTHF
jgi:hypothetical protein